jgi:hypothetical protein
MQIPRSHGNPRRHFLQSAFSRFAPSNELDEVVSLAFTRLALPAFPDDLLAAVRHSRIRFTANYRHAGIFETRLRLLSGIGIVKVRKRPKNEFFRLGGNPWPLLSRRTNPGFVAWPDARGLRAYRLAVRSIAARSVVPATVFGV